MTRLIDADVLFENLDGMMAVSPTWYIHGDTVADMIGDAPTVEAEPIRHGKWLCGDDFDENGICSECEYDSFEPVDYVRDEWKYCPRCGAKMDAERKEE